MNIKLKKNGQLFKFLECWGLRGWESDLCAVIQTLLIVPFVLILAGLVVAAAVLPPLVVIAVAIFGDVSHLGWLGAMGISEIITFVLVGLILAIGHVAGKVSTPKVIGTYITSRKEKYCARVEWE